MTTIGVGGIFTFIIALSPFSLAPDDPSKPHSKTLLPLLLLKVTERPKLLGKSEKTVAHHPEQVSSMN